MKKLAKKSLFVMFLIGLFSFTLGVTKAKACEIKFEIVENEKETYEIGDVITIKVVVILTHRSCPIALKQTKFNLSGLKVTKAEKWEQISTMEWQRTIKVEVTGVEKGDLQLTAVRECDKDGGFGKLTLKQNKQND